ncbi:hypothetical protein RRG08_032271 [Elysia crispata]|uniref:Uncharacterized protein n=1 Tax=Elysia crispata TaxID=231223 RepID=A0AAE1ASJ5_9GAST|nr:hypothetical protein RRG08_032271 [Elysia crispata]
MLTGLFEVWQDETNPRHLAQCLFPSFRAGKAGKPFVACDNAGYRVCLCECNEIYPNSRPPPGPSMVYYRLQRASSFWLCQGHNTGSSQMAMIRTKESLDPKSEALTLGHRPYHCG